MSSYAPPALPVHDGGPTGLHCWDCSVSSGEQHELSCPEVSPALFADYLAWQPPPARPSRLRMVGQAIAAAISALTTTPTQRRNTWHREQNRHAHLRIAAHRRTNGDTP